MKILTATVTNGRIEYQGEPLQEGAKVTILASDGSETFAVTEIEKSLLLAALAEADRGDSITAEELLHELDDLN